VAGENQRGSNHRLGVAALCVVVAILALLGIAAATQPGAIGGLARATDPPVTISAQVDPEIPPGFDPLPSPTYTLTTESPRPEQPPNKPPPTRALPPPPTPSAPPATTPTQAVAAAASAGRSRGVRAAVAVWDRRVGKFYGAGDVDYGFASASVVKTFIAARLLVDGQATDPAIRSEMWQMIVASDDSAATALYKLVGREALISWIVNRYHLSGLAPASVPNYWGLTRITARAMVSFYASVANDPVVGPWLLNAMAHAQAIAADGFPQLFGIPAAARSWRVKQGWMCCLESVTRMHSTGLIDGDRYTVALLTEGATSHYGSYGAQTLTLMAKALLPHGTIPQPPQPSPTAPSLTPTTTPSPTPTTPSPTTPSPTTPSPSPSPTGPSPTGSSPSPSPSSSVPAPPSPSVASLPGTIARAGPERLTR
jgi:Beta-lactamase enzyme family